MLSAKRRLKSGIENKDKIEYFYAIVFYSVFILACFLFVIALTKTNALFNGSSFWAISAFVITVMIFSILYTTSDYNNIANIHNKTIEYYISDINITKTNPLLKYDFKNLLLAFEVFYTIFAVMTFEKFGIMWIYYLLVLNYSLWALFLVFDGEELAVQKVSPNVLKSFDNLDDVNDEEKACFKRSCQAIIEKNSFINKSEVFYIASKLMEYRDKRLQDEICEYEKDLNKEEYKEFMN
jgi:hypothetical protein